MDQYGSKHHVLEELRKSVQWSIKNSADLNCSYTGSYEPY